MVQVIGLRLAEALKGAQIDEDIGESVEIGDGLTVTELGAFDAE